MEAKRVLELIAACESPNGKTHSYEVGRDYLVRATYHHIGRLVAVTDTDLVLQDGGWLADSGRFGECLAKGTVKEIEVVPSGMRRIVSRNDVIDAFPWNHALPTETK
jgi:hypothetical protein